MDETANEIEAHIDRTRERLGSNLRELEDKVDAATDWREHFRERPHLFLGAAFDRRGRAGERAQAQICWSRDCLLSRSTRARVGMALCRRKHGSCGATSRRRWSAWRASDQGVHRRIGPGL